MCPAFAHAQGILELIARGVSLMQAARRTYAIVIALNCDASWSSVVSFASFTSFCVWMRWCLMLALLPYAVALSNANVVPLPICTKQDCFEFGPVGAATSGREWPCHELESMRNDREN